MLTCFGTRLIIYLHRWGSMYFTAQFNHWAYVFHTKDPSFHLKYRDMVEAQAVCDKANKEYV